jgi:hypothetical protein
VALKPPNYPNLQTTNLNFSTAQQLNFSTAQSPKLLWQTTNLPNFSFKPPNFSFKPPNPQTTNLNFSTAQQLNFSTAQPLNLPFSPLYLRYLAPITPLYLRYLLIAGI